MTKTIRLAAAAAALFAAVPLSAQAMPVGAAPVAADAGVTLVSGGCGPAFHRGPFGGCRPNIGFVRPIVRRPVICRTVLLPLPHRVCR